MIFALSSFFGFIFMLLYLIKKKKKKNNKGSLPFSEIISLLILKAGGFVEL